MNRPVPFFLSPRLAPLLVAAALFFAGNAAAQTLPLVPLPASIQPGKGALTIGNGATVLVAHPGAHPGADPGAAVAARLLVQRVRIERGLALAVVGDGRATIRFVRDAAIAPPEGYTLTVSPDGIVIAASSDAGFVYGAMTLSQLLSPDAAFGRPVRVGAVTIADAPRFAWRGYMLDVARHFQPVESIRTIIDAMAATKLNILHLHLTDDQGWRIEIKRYPDLTRIGAFRSAPTAGGTAPGPVHGGFYTQDDLRALVAYAKERAITIVPEIDLPGHAQAVVASYPQFGVLGDRPKVSGDWGVNPYLFNVDEPSMAFIEGVLDEVMDVFPSTFIHLGGDEAVKDQWKVSPAIQARMATLGIKTEDELQSWFVDRLGNYLAKHGRRLIGWDEILEGGLPPSASVMSWRGEKGAIDAVNQGHDVVLAPAPTLYFDSLQTRRGDEPAGRRYFVGLKQVYGYEPMPPGLAPDKAAHVLGAEAPLFTEYMVTPEQVQHATFPRLAAIAEVTWSPQDKRDFAGFLARLDPQRLRYARAGIAAADTEYAVEFSLNGGALNGGAEDGGAGQALRDGVAKVTLATQIGQGKIRYTLDGGGPTARSAAYVAPIAVRPGIMIRAAAFAADGRALAAPRSFDTSRAALLTRTGSDLKPCGKATFGLRAPVTPEAIAWGPVFNINLFDTCSIYPAAPLDRVTGFTIDVQRLPRHYGLAHEVGALTVQYNVTPFGELVVRSGGCTGTIAATFPLPDPATTPGTMRFQGNLPQGPGDADLCLLFTAPLSGPYYTVATMVLTGR